MELVNLKCPNCLGTLTDFDYINSFYCQHCGVRLEIDGQSKTVVRAKLRVREMEHEERVIDKEYQFRTEERKDKLKRERENDKSAARILLFMALPAILFFGGMFLYHYKNVHDLKKLSLEIEEDINNHNYDSAIVKTNRLRLDDGYSSDEERVWEEKRRYYTEIIEDRKAHSGQYYPTEMNAVEATDVTSEYVYDAGTNDIIPDFFEDIKRNKLSITEIRNAAKTNGMYYYEHESDEDSAYLSIQIACVPSKYETSTREFGEYHYIDIFYSSKDGSIRADLVSPKGRYLDHYKSE